MFAFDKGSSILDEGLFASIRTYWRKVNGKYIWYQNVWVDPVKFKSVVFGLRKNFLYTEMIQYLENKYILQMPKAWF